jgi:hypothetical protein
MFIYSSMSLDFYKAAALALVADAALEEAYSKGEKEKRPTKYAVLARNHERALVRLSFATLDAVKEDAEKYHENMRAYEARRKKSKPAPVKIPCGAKRAR